jgi:F-type H+-transporting ATPase subunit a
MRIVTALVVVVLACFASWRFTPHHSGDNPFTVLYMHLIPAALVDDPHAPHEEQHALVTVPVPFLPGAADYRGAHGAAQGSHGDGHGGGEAAHAAPRIALTNLQIFQIAAVLLVFVCLSGVPRYLRTGQGDKLTRVFAGWSMWIRDEMVYPVMGREGGARFLPYFLCLFFFVVFMNLLGLVPFSATATASIFVTAALASITLLSMIGCGMVAQGPIAFFKHLVPHVPLALWPLMFVVELVGLLVKPFALMIRLFANMSGGHMVVLSFMGLIFFFAGKWGAGGGYGAVPVGVGFAVFIMIIEAFVALLQAYIFTQLSILFVQASVHPEH